MKCTSTVDEPKFRRYRLLHMIGPETETSRPLRFVLVLTVTAHLVVDLISAVDSMNIYSLTVSN